MTQPASVKDGFYAWVIVVACFVLRIFIYGMTTTSGILYVIFLDEFKESKGATAIIGSLINAAGFFIGTVSGVLVNRYGCRSVVILAGLVASGGLIISSFAMNVTYLIITYGVISGVGFGLCWVPMSVLVSQYFDKRRNLALGIAASGGGLGSFIFPLLLRWLIGLYGWRGTLLIAGAITLNMCVCGAVMRPFIEHTDRSLMTVSQTKLAQSLFHWDVFKNVRFMLFMLNHLLISFGISAVYVHLSAFGRSNGISEDQSASVFSAMGVFVAISKILTGIVATLPTVDEHAVYIPIVVVGGVCAAILPVYNNVIWFGAMACVFSITYSSVGGCIVPALCLRYAGTARLSTSYGVSLVVDGIGSFIGAPIAGVLYDVTGVYDNSYYLAGILVIVSAIIMFLPWKCLGGDAISQLVPLADSDGNGGKLFEDEGQLLGSDNRLRFAPLCAAESSFSIYA